MTVNISIKKKNKQKTDEYMYENTSKTTLKLDACIHIHIIYWQKKKQRKKVSIIINLRRLICIAFFYKIEN